MVDYTSFGFKKSIDDCMDDEILRSHSRQQQDKTKYEFTMKLTAFNIKEAVLDGSISAKDQLLRYKQGDVHSNIVFVSGIFFVEIYSCLKKLTHHSNIQIFLRRW